MSVIEIAAEAGRRGKHCLLLHRGDEERSSSADRSEDLLSELPAHQFPATAEGRQEIVQQT